MKRRHLKIVNHLLKFNFASVVTEQDKEEYIQYQSNGGVISNENPLLDCQKWKEWTITQLIEESFEWYIHNAGWIYPLLHVIETEGGIIEFKEGKRIVDYKNSKDSITIKAIIKIIDKIEEKGMLDFYLSHPGVDNEETKVKAKLQMKFNNI